MARAAWAQCVGTMAGVAGAQLRLQLRERVKDALEVGLQLVDLAVGQLKADPCITR